MRRNVANGAPLRVGVVGLNFGSNFLPLYRDHPRSVLAAICQRDPRRLATFSEAHPDARPYADFSEFLTDPDLDAVHINTPFPDHARHTLMALRAGKHVACSVPMAMSMADCREIVATVRSTGLKYMMMETMVYADEFLLAASLHSNGIFGRIQGVRGVHHQDMTGWPSYWEGLPPMHYSTHSVGPCLSLLGLPAESVICLGSGRIDQAMIARHGTPFAIETALIRVASSDVVPEITRSLFQTVRQFTEGFSVYGSRMSLEWEQLNGAGAVLFTPDGMAHAQAPHTAIRLPETLKHYASGAPAEPVENSEPQPPEVCGDTPYARLVGEFVSSILNDRCPAVDATTAANWTCVGLAAHESAMAGGHETAVPIWT